ncbi:MAG: hypothetical protein JNK02_06365 [Planctomycetes bacterium]|nr:hypothetical protein [Planctomycetota bacterium]
MSLKSRLLRYSLIGLAVAGFAGYFAFSTLFFNPLESDLEVDVAALAPRDVDFFAARADLGRAIDGFPRLALQDRLDKNPGWQAWIASPEYAALDSEHGIEKTLAELRRAAAELPLGMEPQDLFGGRDLALAGYFQGRGLEHADWAAYGRANWMGKLAASALFRAGWFGLEQRGLKVVVDGDIASVEGGGLARKLFVTRIRDVVVVATKPELVKTARELETRAYADSVYQSALYFDRVQRAPARESARDELELVVDVPKLVAALGLSAPWPDTRSQDFLPAFAGRLFQLGSLKTAAGVVQVGEGASLDLFSDLNTERLTPEMQRVYRARGFSREDLVNTAAAMAPSDTGLFVYLHAGIADLLKLARDSAEKATVSLIEDTFRNTGKFPTLDALIAHLDASFKDRVALIVRPNDYPVDPEGPPQKPHEPVPAWAVVLWSKDVAKIVDLRDTIGTKGSLFGLQGRKPGEPGYFNNMESGFEIREFWSPAIPGTGMIATCNANELTIVSNSFRMLGHILKTSTQGGERYPRLAEEPTFQALVRSSIQNGNVFVWANPRSIAPILRASARQRAAAQLSDRMDWNAERQRVRAKLLREQFAGQRPPLGPEDQERLDRLEEEEIERISARLGAEQVPALVAKEERNLTYAEQVTAALAILALNPRNVELSVRVLAPLSE